MIGGRGFLGSRTCAALERDPSLEIRRGGRTAEVPIDLGDMKTFPAMDPFDVIVNCADSIEAPPDRAILYALNRGLTFVETSGDARTIARLVEASASWHIADDGGRAIVGVGLFPGLTNLMAASVAKRAGQCDRLQIGVALTPLSGSGRGTANLMAAAFGEPARAIVDGEIIEQPSLAPGPRLDFGGCARKTVTMDLAEPAMLAATTGVSNVSSFLAPKPAILYPLLRVSAALRPRGGVLRRAFLAVTRGAVRLLRGVLLRWRSVRVELTAIADGEHVVHVRVRDGFRAAADAIAATVALLGRRQLATGFYLPDAVFELDETVAQMRRQGATLELGGATSSASSDAPESARAA